MHFVDECQFQLEAGDGGNGAVSFRRERFLPFGGPNGGDGGRGGSIIAVGDEGLGSLFDLKHQRVFRAEPGHKGQGSDCYGKSGTDLIIRMPLGTLIYDEDTDLLVAEVLEHGQEYLLAKGGSGGRGNMHFATPIDRAPRRAELGQPGEHKYVRLELKVMADVGLLGYPNVGKSTFIRSVSRAKPKVADYPFTTLVPHLGVATVGDEGAYGLGKSLVLADIPGLIPGASEGQGLGLRFLRHVERTRVLLHLVTLSETAMSGEEDEEREPLKDFDVINAELANFSPELAERRQIVAVTKADIPEVVEKFPAIQRAFAERGIPAFLISSATHQGVSELMYEILKVVEEHNEAQAD